MSEAGEKLFKRKPLIIVWHFHRQWNNNQQLELPQLVFICFDLRCVRVPNASHRQRYLFSPHSAFILHAYRTLKAVLSSALYG